MFRLSCDIRTDGDIESVCVPTRQRPSKLWPALKSRKTQPFTLQFNGDSCNKQPVPQAAQKPEHNETILSVDFVKKTIHNSPNEPVRKGARVKRITTMGPDGKTLEEREVEANKWAAELQIQTVSHAIRYVEQSKNKLDHKLGHMFIASIMAPASAAALQSMKFFQKEQLFEVARSSVSTLEMKTKTRNRVMFSVGQRLQVFKSRMTYAKSNMTV